MRSIERADLTKSRGRLLGRIDIVGLLSPRYRLRTARIKAFLINNWTVGALARQSDACCPNGAASKRHQENCRGQFGRDGGVRPTHLRFFPNIAT